MKLSNQSRVIILGESGFIGSRIAALVAQQVPGENLSCFSSRVLDLTSPVQCGKLIPLTGPETSIVFCAGLQKRSGDSPELLQKNLQMAFNVAEILKSHPVRQVLFLSTAGVYGEDINRGPVDENSPVRPRSCYALSKYGSEVALDLLPESLGISICCLRLPFIYGTGDRNPYGPSHFLSKALAGDEIVLWGDGSEIRNFVYVEDLARLVLRMLAMDVRGVLNVCSPDNLSFRDCVETISQVTSKKLNVSFRERSRNKVDSVVLSKRQGELFPEFRFTELGDALRREIEKSDHV